MRAIWDIEDDVGGNVQHIARHGLEKQDVEDVLDSPAGFGRSRRSGLPCVWGYTRYGLYIIVVYEKIDDEHVYPVTAYVTPEPKAQR